MSAIREIRHRAFAPVLLQLFLVGLPIGIAAMLLIPGILSLGPSAAVSLPELVIPLDAIKPGVLLDLREHPDSRGVPLAIYGRVEAPGSTDETSYGVHADHAYSKEVLPDGVDPATRSASPAIFVFYNLDTRWGCPLKLVKPGEVEQWRKWRGGLLSTCHDYAYDFSGRSIERPHPSEGQYWLPSKNLFVPRHKIADGKLYIYPHPDDIKVGPLD